MRVRGIFHEELPNAWRKWKAHVNDTKNTATWEPSLPHDDIHRFEFAPPFWKLFPVLMTLNHMGAAALVRSSDSDLVANSTEVV